MDVFKGRSVTRPGHGGRQLWCALMIKIAAAGLAMAAIYSDYPAFTKRGGVVEAYTDRGPIVELIVRCPVGTGIISYSKLEKRYCSAKLDCFAGLKAAVARTCE